MNRKQTSCLWNRGAFLGRAIIGPARCRCLDGIMHRKSAYILFLAVLALLVIGIVMLFSTSAFARDTHGDV